jgi:hypothetical protein
MLALVIGLLSQAMTEFVTLANGRVLIRRVLWSSQARRPGRKTGAFFRVDALKRRLDSRALAHGPNGPIRRRRAPRLSSANIRTSTGAAAEIPECYSLSR